MPEVAVTTEEAVGLAALFTQRRADSEARLDRAVAGLARSVARTEGPPAPLTTSELQHLWTRALREGKCVHCHTGTDNRAARYFNATPDGLAAYVGTHGGLAVWKRLATRALEHDASVTAAEPGMPMTAPPVSPELRALFLHWSQVGCPDEAGHLHCGADGGPAPASRSTASKPESL